MVKPSDALALFAVQQADADWTLRSLAHRLGVQHSNVQRSLDRLAEAGIYDVTRRQLVPHAAEEFLLHALKFLRPIHEGRMARGVPTAWGASPLREEIASEEPPPVWPDPRGDVRGPAVQPLDSRLPALAATWPEVAELAALCDALILGDARVREAARGHLVERLSVAV